MPILLESGYSQISLGSFVAFVVDADDRHFVLLADVLEVELRKLVDAGPGVKSK